MSERTWNLIRFAGFMAIASFFIWHSHREGLKQGRAEQKKIDDGQFSTDGYFKIFTRSEVEEKDGVYIQRMVIESPNPLSLDGGECVVRGSEVTEGR